MARAHRICRGWTPLLTIGFTCVVALRTAAQQPVVRDTVVLSLPALVTVALRNNIDLRLAALAPQFAAADLRSARGGFDPSFVVGTELGTQASDVLGVSPRSTQTSNAGTAALGALFPIGSQLALQLRNRRVSLDPFVASPTLPFQTSHASSLNLSLTQPLLRGFGRGGTYGYVDAAALSVDAARSRYDRSVGVTVALVERAYWTLRQSESNESVVQQSVDAARAIAERNVALRARDVATSLDVLTSERGLATRETQLWDATRQRMDAASRLLFLVYGEEARDGILQDTPRVHTSRDSVIVPVIPSLDAADAAALSQRTDVAAAAREVAAGRRRVEQARSQRRPKLDLIASYGYGGTAPSASFLSYGESGDLRNATWSVGFSTSLFLRNDAASAVDQREVSLLESATLVRLATENAVRSDVRIALRALQTGRDRFLRSRDVVRLAEQEYAAAREGARLGLVTTFQLLQYEEQLAQARLLLAQTRFALEDAGTQFRLAVGDRGTTR